MNKLVISTCELANWISGLKDAATEDEQFSVAWFPATKDMPFSIVGGWMPGFSEDYSDLLCISKSNPEYAMCVKIIVNEGPYAYCDFEILNMPMDADGDVYDTCIALEYADDTEAMAEFFLNELTTLYNSLLEEAMDITGINEISYVS